MKKLLISALLLISVRIMCQYGLVDYKNFENLNELTTLVPLFGTEEFNKQYKKTIEENWAYSRVRFIAAEDLEKYLDDDRFTIILPIEKVVIEHAQSGAGLRTYSSNYLTFVRSGRKKVSHYNYKRWYASVLYDTDELKYTLDLTVSALNRVLFVMEEEKFSGRYKKNRESFS